MFHKKVLIIQFLQWGFFRVLDWTQGPICLQPHIAMRGVWNFFVISVNQSALCACVFYVCMCVLCVCMRVLCVFYVCACVFYVYVYVHAHVFVIVSVCVRVHACVWTSNFSLYIRKWYS